MNETRTEIFKLGPGNVFVLERYIRSKAERVFKSWLFAGYIAAEGGLCQPVRQARRFSTKGEARAFVLIEALAQ